jgi:hypothetical protein
MRDATRERAKTEDQIPAQADAQHQSLSSPRLRQSVPLPGLHADRGSHIADSEELLVRLICCDHMLGGLEAYLGGPGSGLRTAARRN